ncbi:MAG: outer membrane protein assembly factor BamA, partial [Myxococcales bacterium]|nr:outer membrane protein assembly factor BamA [Myxococcales bacterium]
MRAWVVTTCLLLGAACLLADVTAAQAQAVSPFDPPPLPSGSVSEIRITGNRRVEESAIRNAIGTQVGYPADRERIRQDILSIRSLSTGGTAFFDDVVVDVTEEGGSVVVSYQVREKPILNSVHFLYRTTDDLDDDVREVVDIEPGDIFDLSRVQNNVEKIEAVYRENSYFLAVVQPTWEFEEDGDVDLVFDITEYEEVEVRRVTFVGNDALSDEELQSVIATRPGSILGFLTGAGVFNDTEFEIDRRRIQMLYLDHGYVEASVGEPTVELSRDMTEIFVTIPVTEGEQWTVRNLEIQGDLLMSADEIRDRFVRMEIPETYSMSRIRSDVERINTYYQDQGYAYADTNMGTRQYAEDLELDLVFDIQKGDLVYIGDITIVGNETTRDQVIRREMRIHESDLYSRTAINISRARINRLGFFDNVEIREEATDDPEIMNLIVDVTERRTGQFQIGAGFSSVESFIFTATIAQNNLFGRGQRLQFQASLSALRTIFSLGFQEPYLFGSKWQFGFELFNREVLFTDFTRTSLGGSVTVGYPFTDINLPGTYADGD